MQKYDDKAKKQKKSKKRHINDCEVTGQAFTRIPQLNIVNCTNATHYMHNPEPHTMTATEPEQEMVQMSEEILGLMEAQVKPDHEFLDLISINLGNNWYGFFHLLGHLRGHIDTVEINTRDYDVSETRYRLLLEWIHNDNVGTLGCLASKLWEHGERRLVKHLAKIYLNKKNNYE